LSVAAANALGEEAGDREYSAEEQASENESKGSGGEGERGEA
jgi:hypothetical protein